MAQVLGSAREMFDAPHGPGGQAGHLLRIVGVIGWPIEHSISPPMHTAAFRALGLDWRYLPFAVHPSRLGEAVAGVRALGLRGVNVTVPHKEGLLSLVDRLTPAAKAIGAVNTVIVEQDGALLGHNTDAQGFLRALRDAGFRPAGVGASVSAIVLGAGGAARAIVYALARAGCQVTILNRTPERAVALAATLTAAVSSPAGAGEDRGELSGGPLDIDTLRREAGRVQLVVNATSAGMWPGIESTPWPESLPFPSGALLYDLVYNPPETRLMQQARQTGASGVGGLGMLVHQGAEAFRLWTGIDPPTDVMRALRACASQPETSTGIYGGDKEAMAAGAGKRSSAIAFDSWPAWPLIGRSARPSPC